MHLILIVINKNGSLVFSKPLSNKVQFTGNELIRLASTFHSMHAISSQITPKPLIPPESEVPSPVLDGIVEIVVDTFVLKALNALTGVKIFLVSEPHTANTQANLLRRVNEAYADFVSKNPFQEAEQPIKSAFFE